MSAQRTQTTAAHALRDASRDLITAGIDAAAGDARRLVAAALGVEQAVLIRDPDRLLSPQDAAKLANYVKRRASREPVSRILGEREFFGRRFQISPDVLDPRPDTETLIETALELCMRESWRNTPIRILDIGTGSGAILLTLLAELPCAVGFGVDISSAALHVAEANAAQIGLTARATFQLADARALSLSSYDLVVSNPPYIPTAEVQGLDPEVANFDPHIALDGGRDGLDFYRWIFEAAACNRHAAQPPQWIVLEAGFGQSEQILELAKQNGLLGSNTAFVIRNDLNSTPRCVAIKARH